MKVLKDIECSCWASALTNRITTTEKKCMKTINILHIEDDEDDSMLIAMELGKANMLFNHFIVSTKQEFLRELELVEPDIILSDHSLPAFNSLEALKVVRQRSKRIPFILVTGNTSEQLAINLLKEGADDYIFKDNMHRLPFAVLNAVRTAEAEPDNQPMPKEQLQVKSPAATEMGTFNQRLQLATGLAGIGIWEWDIVNDYFYVDEGMCRLYKADQFGSTYQDWLSRLHPEDRQATDQAIQRAIATKTQCNAEFRIIITDTHIRYIKAVATIDQDQAGKAIRMTGINLDITKQKKDEQHFKLLESVITHTSDAVMITEAEPLDDEGHRIVYVNEAFTTTTGYSADEVIRKTPKILQGFKSDQVELRRLSEALRKGEPAEITTINYKKNGEPFWANLVVNPVANENGLITHWIAIQKDVTIYKNAELQRLLLAKISRFFNEPDELNTILHRVLEQLSGFTDCSMAEAWLTGKDNKRINLAAHCYSSISSTAVYNSSARADSFTKGKGLPGIVWESEAIQVWRDKHVLDHLVGGDANIAGLETIVGLPIMFNNEVTGVLLLGFSTAEKMDANPARLFEMLGSHLAPEIKRKQLEQDLNQVFNFAPGIVCTVGVNGYFIKMNPVGCELLEYTEEELTAVPLANFIHEDDKQMTTDSILQHRESRVSYYTENRYITKSGQIKWLGWTSSRLQEQGLIFAVGKDITDRKLSEMRLKELNTALRKQAEELAASNADLEQFAFVASHDLQEPLRMVSGFLNLLENKYSDIIDEKGKKYIDFAVEGSRRMRQIIHDLLDYARVCRQDTTETAVDLNELVAEIQVLLQAKIKSNNAVIHVGPLPVIQGFRTPLRQVFQNLVENALKFISEDKPAHINITATELEDEWQFTIADNGIGIAKQHFERIFEIFQRLHIKDLYEGSGMGLALAKKIVQRQGGKIWLDSQEGVGSIFYFTLKKPGNIV